MIIGININSIGDRYIAYIKYDNNLTKHEASITANSLKDFYDEVYVIDINTSYEPFIQHIVMHGCRV